MLILGVDPGISVTGFGLLKSDGTQHQSLSFGAIKLPRSETLPKKLEILHRKISNVIKSFDIESMALEDLFYASNVKSVLRLSQARAVIMLSAAQHDLPVFEYSPLEVKNAVVGYGRAEKCQVQQMLCRLLHLNQLPEPDDAADALAVAICHAQTHSTKIRMTQAVAGSGRKTEFP